MTVRELLDKYELKSSELNRFEVRIYDRCEQNENPFIKSIYKELSENEPVLETKVLSFKVYNNYSFQGISITADFNAGEIKKCITKEISIMSTDLLEEFLERYDIDYNIVKALKRKTMFDILGTIREIKLVNAFIYARCTEV